MPYNVLSSDGTVVPFSSEAVQQSGTLRDWVEDLGEDDEDIGSFPVPVADAHTLRAAAAICEQLAAVSSKEGSPVPRTRLRGASASSLQLDLEKLKLSVDRDDEAVDAGVFALIKLAKFLDMPEVSKIASEKLAAVFVGKSPAELATALGEEVDLSAEEQAAALAESLFAPSEPESGDAADPQASLATPLPIQRETTIGQLLGDDDAIDACLARVDARSLMHLKAVSKKWRRRARWVLSEPMSQWRQEPVWAPTSVVQTGDSITFLNELRKLDPKVELPAYVASLAACLKLTSEHGDHDSPREYGSAGYGRDAEVRSTARELMRKLEPAVNVDAVVRLLADASLAVRTSCLDMLHQMEPDVLLEHARTSLSRLADAGNVHARDAGVQLLKRLEPAELSKPHLANQLVLLLAHESADVRAATRAVVLCLTRDGLERSAPAIAAHLSHASAVVRAEAAAALGPLSASALEAHAAALIANVGAAASTDGAAALRTVGDALPAAALAPHEATISAALGWYKFHVPASPLRTLLSKLSADAVLAVVRARPSDQMLVEAAIDAMPLPTVRAGAGALIECLGDDNGVGVRAAAGTALGTLPAADLEGHVPALAAQLGGSTLGASRRAVLDVLSRAPPASVTPHVAAVLGAWADAPHPAAAVLCGLDLAQLGGEAAALDELAAARQQLPRQHVIGPRWLATPQGAVTEGEGLCWVLAMHAECLLRENEVANAESLSRVVEQTMARRHEREGAAPEDAPPYLTLAAASALLTCGGERAQSSHGFEVVTAAVAANVMGALVHAAKDATASGTDAPRLEPAELLLALFKVLERASDATLLAASEKPHAALGDGGAGGAGGKVGVKAMSSGWDSEAMARLAQRAKPLEGSTSHPHPVILGTSIVHSADEQAPWPRPRVGGRGDPALESAAVKAKVDALEKRFKMAKIMQLANPTPAASTAASDGPAQRLVDAADGAAFSVGGDDSPGGAVASKKPTGKPKGKEAKAKAKDARKPAGSPLPSAPAEGAAAPPFTVDVAAATAGPPASPFSASPFTSSPFSGAGASPSTPFSFGATPPASASGTPTAFTFGANK